MRGHNRLNISTSASMGKIFENLFKKPLSQKKSSKKMDDFIEPIAYRGTNFKVKIETL
jgi:hypothetical protein